MGLGRRSVRVCRTFFRLQRYHDPLGIVCVKKRKRGEIERDREMEVVG
jgi:hypothetical protein